MQSLHRTVTFMFDSSSLIAVFSISFLITSLNLLFVSSLNANFLHSGHAILLPILIKFLLKNREMQLYLC